MKISCQCGGLISDTTDYLPYKAHVISDQDWFGISEAIDEAIEQTGPSPGEKEAACMRIRGLLGKLSRSAWQCSACGSIHIDDPNYRLWHFAPDTDEMPKDLFRSRNS